MRHLQSILVVFLALAPLAEVRAQGRGTPAWGSQGRSQHSLGARAQNGRHADLNRHHQDLRRLRAERDRLARLLSAEIRQEQGFLATLRDQERRHAELTARCAELAAQLNAFELERQALFRDRDAALLRKDELLGLLERRDQRQRRRGGQRLDRELERGAQALLTALVGVQRRHVGRRQLRRELRDCDVRLVAIDRRLAELEGCILETQRRHERLARRGARALRELEATRCALVECRQRASSLRARLTRAARHTKVRRGGRDLRKRRPAGPVQVATRRAPREVAQRGGRRVSESPRTGRVAPRPERRQRR